MNTCVLRFGTYCIKMYCKKKERKKELRDFFSKRPISNEMRKTVNKTRIVIYYPGVRSNVRPTRVSVKDKAGKVGNFSCDWLKVKLFRREN